MEHIRALRRNRWYSKAYLFIFVEANMSWFTPDRIKDLLMNEPSLQPLLVYSYDQSGEMRPGVITSKYNKIMYATHLQELLDDARFHFADPFIAPHMAPSQSAREINMVKNTFKGQLQRFRRERIVPKTGTGEVKIIITGKSTGHCDDMVMAVCMWLYWMRVVHSDMMFIELAQRNSWII